MSSATHPDFSDVRAVFVNCSLKPEPRDSHTMRLMHRSIGIMHDLGVEVDVIHALEHDIAFGMVTVCHRARSRARRLAGAASAQADCGWIGEIGPGASYGDVIAGSDVPVGFDSEFTNKNTTFMTWNLLHLARLLKDAGGFPVPGNQGEQWRDVPNAADHEPKPIG